MQHEVALRQLQMEVDTAHRALKQSQAALTETTGEFQSYKVKVHAVLKQQKETQPAPDRLKQLEEEVNCPLRTRVLLGLFGFVCDTVVAGLFCLLKVFCF